MSVDNLRLSAFRTSSKQSIGMIDTRSVRFGYYFYTCSTSAAPHGNIRDHSFNLMGEMGFQGAGMLAPFTEDSCRTTEESLIGRN